MAKHPLHALRGHPGRWNFWIDIVGGFVLLFGLSLILWSSFVGGWVLAGIGAVRLLLTLAFRRWSPANRPRI